VKYLLDTHVVSWSAQNDPRLSLPARKIVAEATRGELAILDVTLSELARHLATGAISSHLPSARWLEQAAAGLVILPVTPAIALLAATLNWETQGVPHRDPCDRHIVAAALAHHLPLLTIDAKMHALSGQHGLRVIW